MTLVLDEKTELTTIGELLREAAGQSVEIRDADGELIATLEMSTVKDGFDYGPYLPLVERELEEIEKRAASPGPWLTTEEFLSGLREPEMDE